MPTAQPAPLSGPGTFAATVVPPLNGACNVLLSTQVSIEPTDHGFVMLEVTDTLQPVGIDTGWGLGVVVLIEDADRAAGFKVLTINGPGYIFPNAAALQASVAAFPADKANPQTAPALSSAILKTFTAAQSQEI